MRCAASLVLLQLAGCASVSVLPTAGDSTGVPAPQLLDIARSYESPSVTVPPAVALTALDDDMRRFLAEKVTTGSSYGQLRQLVRSVVENPGFSVVYDDRSRTAAETFHARHGNCLSFTNLMVGLAREVGLRASYQEVDIPPDWTRAGELVVLNRHINAHFDLGLAGEHVVDFDIGEFRAAYPRRRISDQRAVAHFYNNLGVEALRAGVAGEAFAMFRAALDVDPTFEPAWINLGAAFRRVGRPKEAERSYYEALRHNPREMVAVSNLAVLFREAGDASTADELERRVTRHRNSNPYYRFALAEIAYREGHYAAAIDHLRFAYRAQPADDRFAGLLGLSYLQLGKVREAERWFTRAGEMAVGDDKRRYVRKLELLRAAANGVAPTGSLPR